MDKFLDQEIEGYLKLLKSNDSNVFNFIKYSNFSKNIKDLLLIISKFELNTFDDNLINLFDDIYNVLCKIESNSADCKSFLFLNRRHLNYILSYQNKNVKKILEKSNNILAKAYEFNKNKIIKKNNQKIKILVIDYYMFKDNKYSSVFRDRGEILKRLNNNIFEKQLICPKISEELIRNKKKVKEFLNSFDKIHYINEIRLDDIYRHNINVLRSGNFDIVIYPSIGMSIYTNLFANERIAPIQINTWGHSITSGIDTIDYYITSNLFEDETAQENYSEKLIRLDSLTTYYLNDSTKKFFSKESLNLPVDKKFIFLMFSNKKFNLPFLNLMGKIIENKKDIIYLISNNHSFENKNIIKQVLNNQVLFIDLCGHNIFCSYMYHSEIILDTFPFGGCNSSMEAFGIGKIVITMPSRFLPGRFTMGFYKKMGIDDAIVDNFDDYAKKAIFYLDNINERNILENRIKEKSHLLFNDDKSVEDWQNMLIELYKKDINPDFSLNYIKLINNNESHKNLSLVPKFNYLNKVTVLILTNKTHKSLECLELLLLNLQENIPELNNCNKLICHDVNKNDTQEYYEKLNELTKKFDNTEFYLGDKSFIYNNKKYQYQAWGANILDLIIKCKTPYFLFCEHDWIFTDKINIKHILQLFDENNFINYIKFNKRYELGPWDIYSKFIENVNLTRVCNFTNWPYFSRKSIWIEVWLQKLIDNGPITTVEHDITLNITSIRDLYKNWGLFTYGKIGDKPLIKHTDGRDIYQNDDKGISIEVINKEIKSSK
jgi:hypothetical protein